MERKALLKTQFCVVFKILICLPTSNLFNNLKGKYTTSTLCSQSPQANILWHLLLFIEKSWTRKWTTLTSHLKHVPPPLCDFRRVLVNYLTCTVNKKDRGPGTAVPVKQSCCNGEYACWRWWLIETSSIPWASFGSMTATSFANLKKKSPSHSLLLASWKQVVFLVWARTYIRSRMAGRTSRLPSPMHVHLPGEWLLSDESTMDNLTLLFVLKAREWPESMQDVVSARREGKAENRVSANQ